MTNEQTRTAAAAASVIPFACVICFDEFNTSERPPMVLPCGHTYVCLPCTKRLRRCMECREPLFLVSSVKQAPSAAAAATTNPGRYSPNPQQKHHHHQQQQHKAPSAPIPLPIPKNVVLVALMEAAERQKQIQKLEQHETSHSLSQSSSNDDDDDDNQDRDDEEAFNLDHIITGMATLSGPCGTYAVRDHDGLPLYAHDPRAEGSGPPESVPLPQIPSEPTNSLLDNDDDDDDDDDDDVENDDAIMAEEKKQDDNEVIMMKSIAKKGGDELQYEEAFVPKQNKFPQQKQPHQYEHLMMEDVEILSRGQKLQIVSFEDGVAKLARGRGYVRASSKQLVKVGEPLDEACRLEGLLDTVRNRGRDLQATLNENNRIEEKIARQLQEAQSGEPAQPVITEPPPEEEGEVQRTSPHTTTTLESPQTPTVEHCMTTPEKHQASRQQQYAYPHREQFYTPRTDLGHYVAQGHGRIEPHSPASIDNSDIMMLPNGPTMPRYGHSASFEEQENHQPFGGAGFGCGVGLSLEGAEDMIHRTQPPPPTWLRSGRRDSTDHSSNLTPSLTSSFDGVDFRTGLSGHRGLSHARKLHNSPKPRSQIRMMGEHRGIAHVRSRRGSVGQEGSTPTSTSSTVTILESSPTFAASFTPTHPPHYRSNAAVPALGPRFSTPSTSS